MNTLRRAVNNSAVMFGSQIITWTATLILTAALGRYLGVAGFGDLYLAMSFGVIFSGVVTFGLDQQLVRAVARERSLASSYLIHSLVLKLVLSGLAYGMIIGITYLLGYPAELRLTIAVYCIVMLFHAISESTTAVFQSYENLLHPALGTVIEKVFVATGAIFLLTRGYGVVAVAAVFVIGGVLGAFWRTLFLRRLVRLHFALDVKKLRPLMIGALPFFVYWMLSAVYFRIDTVLLSVLSTADVVGWYGAAYKLFDTLGFLPSIICSAIMYPILSRLAVQSRANLRFALGKGLDVMLMLGIPICTGLFMLAEPIIELIYGTPAFLNAVPALQWLAPALFILYVNWVLGTVLVGLDQEKRLTVVAGLSLVINLGLNWLVIPQYQHVGAAAVTAGTELFIFGYMIVILPRDLLSRSSLIVFVKATASAGAMAAVLYALRGQSILVLVPLGGVVYCLTALLLRLVPPDDFQLFKQVVLNRGRRNADGTETA